MVTTLKKIILTIIFAVLLTSAFCACGKKQESNPFGGVPDRVISRSRSTEPTVSLPKESDSDITTPADTEQQITDTQPDTMPSSDSEAADITSQTADSTENNKTEPSSAKQTESKQTEKKKPESSTAASEDNVSVDEIDDENRSDVSDDDNVSVTEQEGMAMSYLKLLNSSKVHAVLIEAETLDAVEISSVKREFYINGKKAVYINDNQKIIMTEDTVTVIDTDEKTYYTHPRDGEDGEVFGYSPASYVLQSTQTDDNGNVVETYTITQNRNTIKSTWTISPNGEVTVKDESVEFGSFRWYRFEVISKDISGMDMTLPEGLELVEPEDIM